MRLSEYEALFDLAEGDGAPRGASGVTTVTWRAGASLEIACHPTVELSHEARREAKRRRTSPAMARINARNTERHMMRLIEANFTTNAVVVTGTYPYPTEEYGMASVKELSDLYDRRNIPLEMERVRMDVRNWIAQLKRRVSKAGGDVKSFKWLVRIEEGKRPMDGELPGKFHFHAIVEGENLDSETVKALWEARHGWAHVDPLRLRDDGAASLARYFCKQKSGGRWWSHSRNLKIVRPRVSRRHMSRRRLALLAADVRQYGREIFEKLYPGYRVVELPEVRFSDFVPGAFIYCRMRRRD